VSPYDSNQSPKWWLQIETLRTTVPLAATGAEVDAAFMGTCEYTVTAVAGSASASPRAAEVAYERMLKVVRRM
jgi:hypothetical protein